MTPNAHRAAATAVPAIPSLFARRRRGFTLVEILTVVIILGIASAIIAPQIGSRNDIKVRAAARVLVADLLYAQNMAISQQKFVYVKFDAAAENYRLMDTPAAGGEMKHPVTKADKFIMQLGPAGSSSLSDVKIKSSVFNGVDAAFRPEFTVAFDELGQPHVYCYDDDKTNEMLDGTIVLECGNDTMSVVIERYTGEIRVE